jgi:hypothetical protein
MAIPLIVAPRHQNMMICYYRNYIQNTIFNMKSGTINSHMESFGKIFAIVF